MGELYDECRRLKAHDLARLVHSDSPSGLELEPVGGPTGSTGKSPTAPIEAWPPRERHAVEKSPSAGKMSEASASSPSGGFGSGGFGSGGSLGDERRERRDKGYKSSASGQSLAWTISPARPGKGFPRLRSTLELVRDGSTELTAEIEEAARMAAAGGESGAESGEVRP